MTNKNAIAYLLLNKGKIIIGKQSAIIPIEGNIYQFYTTLVCMCFILHNDVEFNLIHRETF